MEKEHWEGIYASKSSRELSWSFEGTDPSLVLLEECGVPLTAHIVDVGGGESTWAGLLLDLGFTNLTVVDISAHAIDRARVRLGARADLVEWVVCDVAKYTPTRQVDVWHDRATFHFLTNAAAIRQYADVLWRSVVPGGVVLLSTFAENGPERCSGLRVQRYSELDLASALETWCRKERCFPAEHVTPWGTAQAFLHCSFRRRAVATLGTGRAQPRLAE
jgi:SAM-dependent methyltransferase